MTARDPWAEIPAQPPLKSLAFRVELPESNFELCREAMESGVLFRIHAVTWHDWSVNRDRRVEVEVISIGTRDSVKDMLP